MTARLEERHCETLTGGGDRGQYSAGGAAIDDQIGVGASLSKSRGRSQMGNQGGEAADKESTHLEARECSSTIFAHVL
jgi:hypothetical protein